MHRATIVRKATWALAWGCVWLAAAEAVAREWSDTTGKFRVQAEFVASRNGKVILEKPDGSIISVPLEKLSAADQAFVRSLAAAKPAATPPATLPAAAAPVTPSSLPPATGAGAALAQQAHGILQKSCHRCHGQEGASEGGFNFVLNFEKLAGTFVKPKNPGGSLLFERLTDSGDSAMPPPDEEPRPTAAEIATIKAWIEAGAPAVSTEKPREFVTNDQVMKYILADVRAANERSRRFLRYFTITHLYNAGVSEDELQTYRNAFVKLANSLSWNSSLIIPEAIDPARTVLRVDLRQMNWTTEIWEEIEAANPYYLNLTTPDAQACYEATQCKMPNVRIDWFVFAGSKPPLYHTILGIPGTDLELEQLLRVNAQANIDQEQVIRAGFNRSGVSQNNRLIEWHKSPYGSYWKSYDFGGNTGHQNLFEYPLGPTAEESFKHDGGELIFTLPNGLQGYMLADNEGKRIDKGPTDIVSDPKQLDKTVTNGVSCMSCHYTGVIPKTDEVGAVVRANSKAFSNAEDILALYREPKELNAVLDEDAKRFAAAMDKIGIKSLSRSGEPISTMASRFEQELDLKLTACEFGLPAEEFEKRMKESETMARSFGPLRTSGGTIKRDVFATLFGQAAIEFRLSVEGSVSFSAGSPSPIRLRKQDDGKPGEVRRFPELGWGVTSLAFSPNGGFLAAGKMDEALLMFNVNEGSRQMSLEKLSQLRQVTACIFTPDGSKLLAGGYSGQILIWNVSKDGTLKEVGQFVGHSQEIDCIAVSSDGRFALSGSKEKKVRYWQIDTGKEQAAFGGFEGQLKACHIAPGGGRTGLATDGETLLHLDLARGKATKTSKLSSSVSSLEGAAISPDGTTVAVGDSKGVRLFSVRTGNELPKLEDNEMQWSAAFTPDGSRLITGGTSKVNVWDVRKQRKIASLPVGEGSAYIQNVATSADNKHIAAISRNAGQDLQVFRIPTVSR